MALEPRTVQELEKELGRAVNEVNRFVPHWWRWVRSQGQGRSVGQRRLSAAARKRISAAQKARWRKFGLQRSERKGNIVGRGSGSTRPVDRGCNPRPGVLCIRKRAITHIYGFVHTATVEGGLVISLTQEEPSFASYISFRLERVANSYGQYSF